ncbi:homing endonuclease associated repeat-containing protein [Bacillus anthracis]|uniref:Uncharacterized protein n=1 Tax=Bacillus anthracis TaxID=1392 RepID=A0A0J1HXC2_BACAN|nr:hypothetical protein [Bacillus anthracis]KLV18336.1 hypothetical protein ABW01_13215 [Bacillus anthracis]
MKEYNKEKIIELIQKKAKELNRVPKLKDITTVSQYRINLHFGNWSKALEAAGVKPNKVGRNRGKYNKHNKYNKEQIIELIQKKAKELNRVPKLKETIPQHVLNKIFDNWNDALIAAGFDPNRKYNPNSRYLTDKQILENIQSVASKLGKTPRLEDVPYSKIAINRFGSWSNALLVAGLKLETKGNYTKEELIQIIRDKYERLGYVPRLYEIKQAATITKVFGSWENALLEADLKSERYKSDEELLEELIQFGNKIGRKPRKVDCDKHKFPIGKYQRRFGSWNNALKLAGFNTSRKKYTRQEIVKEVQQLAKDLNKVPSSVELAKISKIYYYSYFKSWSEVLEAAGFTSDKPVVGYNIYDEKTVSKKIYTRKEVIEAINSKAKKIQRIPLIADMAITEDDIFRYFDSWEELLEVAGIFKLFNITPLYSQEQLISELITHAKRLNRNPKPNELNIGKKWFEYQFGSWERALLVAGLSPEADITFTREKIIKRIQDVAHGLKRIPKQSETGIHTNTYRRFFPTWEKALEAASVNKRMEIINIIQETAIKLGRTPRTIDVPINHTRVNVYFGNWSKALKAAGFGTTRGFSKKELINMIKECNQKTGRVPRIVDLPVTQAPFVRQFGSYKKALEAAGFDPLSNYKNKEKKQSTL